MFIRGELIRSNLDFRTQIDQAGTEILRSASARTRSRTRRLSVVTRGDAAISERPRPDRGDAARSRAGNRGRGERGVAHHAPRDSGRSSHYSYPDILSFYSPRFPYVTNPPPCPIRRRRNPGRSVTNLPTDRFPHRQCLTEYIVYAHVDTALLLTRHTLTHAHAQSSSTPRALL